MVLEEQTEVPLAALPIVEFKEHLRLGTGFAETSLQDSVLETCLRASLATIEGRTGKALISRPFRWALSAWRELGSQPLPLAPVRTLLSVAIRDRFGVETPVDPDSYWLVEDDMRPLLAASHLTLPTIPVGGQAVVTFEAGFGPNWSDMPADLARASMLLAAQYYETRDASGAKAVGVPPLVAVLIDRYRTIRTLAGGMV